jgi:dTDP-4-dehydrorhamnose reductase
MDADVHLVIGADGRLGGGLRQALAAAGQRVLATSRRRDGEHAFLDLAAPPETWALPAEASVAYLCAAVTSQAACERDPDGTRRVNVRHTVALASRLAAAGAFVVFPSTNLVFDGTRPARASDDAVCPRTAYGRQKAAAEADLLALGAAVVRLTKVIAPDDALLCGWARSLRAGETIHPFADLVFAPLPLAFVARALMTIAARRGAGLWQLSGERDVSYADAARHLARRLGADEALIVPGSAQDAGIPAGSRPPHTTLDTRRWREAIGTPLPSVEATLDTLRPA